MNNEYPAPQCHSPVRGDVTSARCPCTFQLTLATIPSARSTECPKKERERLRRLATKILRKREREREQQRGQRNNNSHQSKPS